LRAILTGMIQDPAAPDSPCNGICRLDTASNCIGCGRHVHEIMEWPNASEQRRHEIVAAARERLTAIRGQAVPDPQ
jgi:predicted Fe-S protein YdhL (DUF1289 family)